MKRQAIKANSHPSTWVAEYRDGSKESFRAKGMKKARELHPKAKIRLAEAGEFYKREA